MVTQAGRPASQRPDTDSTGRSSDLPGGHAEPKNRHGETRLWHAGISKGPNPESRPGDEYHEGRTSIFKATNPAALM